MAREFIIEQATREHVPLLIGLMGGPSAGKTYSALTLATGMRTPDTGRPVVIDTEGGRTLKYAPLAGEVARAPLTFDFERIDFEPPYRSIDLLGAAQKALASNPCAIIFDSMSDEHEGIGGLLDWHDEELDRMAGADWAKRERVGQAAWIKPKQSRRTMVNGLLQIKTPMIFCFRAREKVKQIKNDRGKMEPTNIGWQPIAPAEIVHAMDVNCMLPLNSDGVPRWTSDKASEDFVLKLPLQFLAMFHDGEPITAETGRLLAEWARGGATPIARARDLLAEGNDAAAQGKAAFGAFWNGLGRQELTRLAGSHNATNGWQPP